MYFQIKRLDKHIFYRYIMDIIHSKQNMRKLNIAHISFSRRNGYQLLSLRVSPKIAAIFQTAGAKIKTSEKYKNANNEPLTYHEYSDTLAAAVGKIIARRYYHMQSYGTNLIDGGTFNFSLLRTVGIEQGITVQIQDLILNEDVNKWIIELSDFLKMLGKIYITKTLIRANLSIEL